MIYHTFCWLSALVEEAALRVTNWVTPHCDAVRQEIARSPERDATLRKDMADCGFS